ncbi:hypothetical protein [Bradyrhizobium sp. AZCC 2289]|uniref:hypothetical protein n=1 Tax=Bradyrhizobium sp. AZCC 2289 TaxID=3117026 RepID=UPI002FEEE809
MCEKGAEAELKIATAIATADRRVSEVKHKAAGYAIRLGKRSRELENILFVHQETIAQQEAEISELRALTENGISLKHSI